MFDMPENDYVKISLDDTPLPMPDELPPECDYDDFECLEVRAAIIENLNSKQSAQAPQETRGSAMADSSNPDTPAIPVLVKAEKKQKRPPGQACGSAAPGRALRDACFQSAMFFPRKIMMMGHWAHDLKLGKMSGRKVIGILSVVCLILLVILMFAALWRSNSMRGLL